MQISWSKSRRFPIFNISAAPHSSMAAHGGRAHKNIQIIFHFSPKRHLSGSRSLVVFGIPAEARLPYQAKQVRCKVGAHGRSVSRWIPNVKAHPNPERWDTTLKLRSLEKGGRWGRRGERAPGEEKNRWQHFKAAVLWIMGDNVTADFCRRSQWCRVSFFMDSITHCFSFLLFLFYTAVNNTPLHALGGPVFFLELFRRWAQFTCHHFLHNEIISFFRRPN